MKLKNEIPMTTTAKKHNIVICAYRKNRCPNDCLHKNPHPIHTFLDNTSCTNKDECGVIKKKVKCVKCDIYYRSEE